MAIQTTVGTTPKETLHLSQIEIVSAIISELDRQGMKELVPRQFNAIIAGVNEMLLELHTPFQESKPNGGVYQWLASDDVGLSSKFLASVVFPEALGRGVENNYPHDADDFGRCYRLAQACPEVHDKIHLMKEHGPIWSRIAEHWGDLCQLMPNAKKVDMMIRSIVDEGRREMNRQNATKGGNE